MRKKRAYWAHAVLLIFTLMLVFSLSPLDDSSTLFAADLFWMPFPQPASPEATATARLSAGQARGGFIGPVETFPFRQGTPFLPQTGISLSGGRVTGFWALTAPEEPAIPVLALSVGGRAPPMWNFSNPAGDV